MLLTRFIIFIICVIVLSISTSALVEFFICQRPEYNSDLWKLGLSSFVLELFLCIGYLFLSVFIILNRNK